MRRFQIRANRVHSANRPPIMSAETPKGATPHVEPSGDKKKKRGGMTPVAVKLVKAKGVEHAFALLVGDSPVSHFDTIELKTGNGQSFKISGELVKLTLSRSNATKAEKLCVALSVGAGGGVHVSAEKPE